MEDSHFRQKTVNWREKYDRNNTSIVSYLRYFKTFARLYDYTEQEACSQLLLSFGKDVPHILKAVGDDYDLAQLERVLREYYEPASQIRAYRTKLRHETRGENQTPRQFLEKLEELYIRAYPDEEIATQKDRLLDLFLSQQPTATRQALAMRCPQTIDEAVSFLDSYEIMNKEIDSSNKKESAATTASPAPARALVPQTATVAQAVTRDEPAPVCSHEHELDAMVDQSIAEVNATYPQMLPDGSVEDPVDFVDVFNQKVAWRFPRPPGQLQKCLYCEGNSHDESSCYKLIRRLNQRGFDITRYRPRNNFARPVPPLTPYRYPGGNSPYKTQGPLAPVGYDSPRRIYGPGQSPWWTKKSTKPKVDKKTVNKKKTAKTQTAAVQESDESDQEEEDQHLN